MRPSKSFLLLAALAATVALVGCSNSSDSAGSSGGGLAKSDAAASATRAAGALAAPARAAAGGGSAASKTTGDGDDTPLGSAKIRTAELTVAVRGAAHVAQQADRAEDVALQAGGEVDADDRSGGKDASATLRLRVPPAQLRSVVTALGRLGTERSRSSSTTDVTEKVADVDARLTSARDTITRLRALYAQATKVSDVLAVEGELSDREADLESLEAQQRALSRQTALATVSFNLETARTTTAPPQHHDKYAGFVGGLRRGWDAFLGAARGVGAAVGASLPFLIVLLLLGLAARVGLRRLPTRRRPTSPPAAE